MKNYKIQIITIYETEINAKNQEQVKKILLDGNTPFDYSPNYVYEEKSQLHIIEIDSDGILNI